MNVETRGSRVIGVVASFGVFGMNSVVVGSGVVGFEVIGSENATGSVIVDCFEVGAIDFCSVVKSLVSGEGVSVVSIETS